MTEPGGLGEVHHVEEPHPIDVSQQRNLVPMPAQRAVVAPGAMGLLELAVNKDLDIEKLKALVEMHRQEQAAAAERAFNAAMAAFQRRCPPIAKGRTVDYTTKDGQRVHYKHAELSHIQPVIRPLLAELGLSYSWSREYTDKGPVVVCTVAHEDGHSRRATFPAPRDERSTKMSDQQREAAANTFAERYALVMALGLVTADPDTDGIGPAAAYEKVTEQQAADLVALADEVKVKMARILKAAKVERVEDFPAARFRETVEWLEKKREGKGGSA